jgi:hypothetical protein
MIIEVEDNYFKKINTSNFRKQIISYQKENPCCVAYPTHNCTHAKHQSDSLLHKKFSVFENSLHSCLKKKNIKVNITHLWAFITYKNENIDSIWHSHYINNNKKQLTALMYLTDNDIGTEFENNYIIKPKINKWFLWDSKLNHKPLETKVNKTRIIISTGLEVLDSV